MKKSHAMKFLVLLLSLLLFMACSKTPEDIRAWLKDKRAPVKMKEFIEKTKNPLVKVEAIMVLVERGQADKIEDAVVTIPKDELNELIALVAKRLEDLMHSGNETHAMRAKDAAYFIKRLKLNEENNEALDKLMLEWLATDDNFHRPLEHAGRVEQMRMFETIGSPSLGIFIDELDKLFVKLREIGPDPAKSTEIQRMMLTIHNDLDSLKLTNADNRIAELFTKHFKLDYPDLAEIYSAPFLNNNSPKLLELAKEIIADPEYKNRYLNGLKDIIIHDYFKNVQKEEGKAICQNIIKNDKTGFVRWMCIDFLLHNFNKEGVEITLHNIPTDISALVLPEDHPVAADFSEVNFVYYKVETFCRTLPFALNQQVPLELFRDLAVNGNTIQKIFSITCLSYNGATADKALIERLKNDKTNIRDWNIQSMTIGQFAQNAEALFDARHQSQKEITQKYKENEEAEKQENE